MILWLLSLVLDLAGRIWSRHRPLIRHANAKLLAILFIAACISIPAAARADGISALVELNYNHADQKFMSDTQDTDLKSDIFRQRYRLSLDRHILPNLLLTASSLFEHTKLWSTTDEQGLTTDSTASETKVFPTVDLKLDTPFYYAGVGYSMLRQSFKAGGDSLPDEVRKTITANLGFRPDGLPQADAIYTHNVFYDSDRASLDRTEDNYLLTLKYRPRPELDLTYAGQYTESEDRLNELKVNQWAHSGRVQFNKEFFRRVNVSSTYNGFYRETEIIRAGKGIITTQVLPFAGLSALSDTPMMVQLDPNPALIDGDVAAGSGVNIGPVPVGGDKRPRNMGLDFFNTLDLNTLHVWVDRPLPASVVNSFTWTIYTSSDNLNWSLYQVVSPAAFGAFENRFEITFPRVKTRYIKVVVSPLSPGIIIPPGFDVSSIFVTEMQAFLSVPASDVASKTTDYSHIYSLDVRTRIYDSPYIVHNLSYWLNWGKDRDTVYTLSNALTVAHRFSRVFSGSARAAVDTSTVGVGRTTSYVFGASLTAQPLQTLNHTLVYSARRDDDEQGESTNQSVYLSNWAELYKGINFTLVGGISKGTSAIDEETKSTTASAGLNLVPRNNLTINVDYTWQKSEKTGGPSTDAEDETRSLMVTATYQPFTTLYLYGSFTRTLQKDKDPETLQSYSASWSPFPGGALQISFFYSEDLRSSDNARITSYGPSLRWNINYRTSLDVAYNVTKETSEGGESVFGAGTTGGSGKNENDLKSLSVTFRTMF